MKQSEFITTVANVSGLSKAVVRDVLETAGDVVSDVLHQADAEIVSVPGFGKFKPRKVQVIASWRSTSEDGVERIEVACKAPKFSPGKRFREMVATGTYAPLNPNQDPS